ncbi:hypothetical protein [Bacillus sp. FJAT-26390]|uniref:hypothetical protein n=1 Tax=Bacillus sp. FJAT-26390 TaxID=1743142 RepID=UPI000807EF8D|nr:hypothetical protein [Bacillus sp. FJAT-26390]OBZ10147.1 hypothetical protein A7975_22580 [Bacillus sp. FJAT-26390]
MIAIGTVVITIILFVLDGLFVHDGHWFDNFGISATFIIPPIGIVFAILALRKTDSNTDLWLVMLNIFVFFLYFVFMLFGTLLFGP